MSVICKFYLENSCRFGVNCRHLHSIQTQPSENSSNHQLPQEATSINPQVADSLHTPFCRNIETVEGCRYGDFCRFSHDMTLSRQLIDNSGLIAPTVAVDSADVILYDEMEVKNQDEYTCGICFEKIKTFGILIGCNHALCIGCINTWRKGASETQSEEHKKSRRSCPLCRQHSDFVITSDDFVQGKAKEDMVDQRLAARESVMCRDWTLNNKCKFSGFCFYAHRDENGNCVKEQQKREFEVRKQRLSSPRSTTAYNNQLRHFARMSRIEFQFLVRYMANMMTVDDVDFNFDDNYNNDGIHRDYREDGNDNSRYRDGVEDQEYEY